MTRRLIAGLIVVGLAIGVWLLWPKSEPGTDTTTTALGVGSTTTSGPTTVPETSPDSTTTGTTLAVQNRDVDTVEEAEAILREVIASRYNAIFAKDIDLLIAAVASQTALESGIEAFDLVDFVTEPTLETVVVSNGEILAKTDDCLVVWARVDVSDFVIDAEPSSAVSVLRFIEGRWRWMSLWRNRNDLWEADCESLLEPLSPP